MTKKKPIALVDEKIAFAERHIKNKEGVPWRIKGREWIRDEFWLPADGWKLWRFEDSEPCDSCVDQIGNIIGHPADNPTTKCKCGGLCAEPILVTFLILDRGDGKTFNLMAYSMATLFKAKHKSMAALWASEDQGKRIFEENWERAIEQSSALRSPKRSRIHGTPQVLDALQTKSRLHVLSTSHRSVTGGRLTHILIDEGRDINAQTVAALMPSTNAMHGVECPAGHVRLTPEDVEKMKRIPKTCSACRRRLSPWWPRVIIVSAVGVLKGNETDWLHQVTDKLETTPHKNAHLFTSAKWGKKLNPRKSEKVSTAMVEIFGESEAMRHHIAAEYGGVWSRKGDDAMNAADVKRVTDNGLHNEDGNGRRSIGFLDTSLTVEKTSIVILSEEDDSESLWEKVYLSYLEFWWPKHGRCSSWKQVKPAPVKAVLESLLPLYPGMVKFVIDTKVGSRTESEGAWPVILYRELKAGAGDWRRKVERWNGTSEHGDIGWGLLLDRAEEGTIRLQKSKEIIDEINGVMMVRPKQSDKPARVVDRNREIMHKDITQSLADLCWLMKLDQLHGTRYRRTVADVEESVSNRLKSGGTKGQLRRLKIGDFT